MKSYETSSCGYTLKFNGPASVEDYDSKANRPGACLDDACKKTINTRTAVDWQEAFASLLAERTGIPRKVDDEATARAKSRSRNPNGVTPVNERLSAYNTRVISEWANGDQVKRAALQEWAQEIADKIEIDPSPPVTAKTSPAPAAGKSGDLAKANEILSHDYGYIEERVKLMLSEVADYVLVRDDKGKPDPQSLARLLNRYIIAKLKL
jgi:hypothetical protein